MWYLRHPAGTARENHSAYPTVVRSIAAKGEWILKNGMKGMMFWDYEGDDTMGTLRKALWNAVMKK